MNDKTTITPRGWFVLGFAAGVLLCLFTYATSDVCYVGSEYGNWLGYGSCSAMVDRVVSP
jgi:hypothetical protein